MAPGAAASPAMQPEGEGVGEQPLEAAYGEGYRAGLAAAMARLASLDRSTSVALAPQRADPGAAEASHAAAAAGAGLQMCSSALGADVTAAAAAGTNSYGLPGLGPLLGVDDGGEAAAVPASDPSPATPPLAEAVQAAAPTSASSPWGAQPLQQGDGAEAPSSLGSEAVGARMVGGPFPWGPLLLLQAGSGSLPEEVEESELQDLIGMLCI